MVEILEFQPERDIDQLLALVNGHISSLVPGWEIPAEYLVARLQRNPEQYITDPWVERRRTLVAYTAGRLVAGIHLRKDKDDSPSEGAWGIEWFLCWPDQREIGAVLLAAACRELEAADAEHVSLRQDLYVPFTSGSPGAWPHISDVLERNEFQRPGPDRVEYVFAGYVPEEPAEPTPPLAGLKLVRRMGQFGTRFEAVIEGKAVAWCECVTALTQGGRLPALRGWADVGEVHTHEGWRNRGIGTWLLGHVNQWLRLGGYTRVLVCVAKDDHDNGAGRFYERFGWRLLQVVHRNHVWRPTP